MTQIFRPRSLPASECESWNDSPTRSADNQPAASLRFLVNAPKAFGRVDGSRTRDRQIMSLMLLPTELPSDAAPFVTPVGNTSHSPISRSERASGRASSTRCLWFVVTISKRARRASEWSVTRRVTTCLRRVLVSKQRTEKTPVRVELTQCCFAGSRQSV